MRVLAGTSGAVDVVSAAGAHRPQGWLLTVKRVELQAAR